MTDNTQWATPTPLRPNGANLMPFPVNALPPILRDMAYATARTTSTDVSMAATALLSSISYCFSGQYRIVGKKDHTEPPVLYSIIIAQPSERKSPVMHFIKEPFDSFESKYNKDHREEMYKAQQDVKALEARVKAMEKEDKPDTAAIAKLRVQADNIRNTTPIRIAVDDITPESLVRQLAINGTLLMMSDEAGSLGNFNGRYSANGTPNLDLLLKSWNGETYISDRITRESITIYKPYVSICLACQPYIWENMLNNTAFRGSGFLARLVYCFPKDLRGNRKYNTEPIPDSVSNNYRSLIFKLLNEKFRRFEQNQTDEHLLYLDTKASNEYVFLHDEFIEKQLVTDMAFCTDWGGKFHGLVLRICGILHCIKAVLDGHKPDEMRVSFDTMVSAIEIGHYFREQAIYAFSLGDIDTQTMQAERIISKIKAKRIQQIKQNDLYQICRCKLFKNAQEFGEIIAVLEEYGYLKSETIPGANNNPKSSTMLYINPRIFS